MSADCQRPKGLRKAEGEIARDRLRVSIFPKVPPYHVFLPPWEHFSCPPCPALREEEWQFPAQIMPVVRDCVAHAGFRITKGMLRCDEEEEVLMAGFIWDNLPLVEKAVDAIDFRRLRAGVKINKFPGFLDLNRKDELWKNFCAMQQRYGREAFGFHPDTYRLPAEHKELVARMKAENYSKVYIVKLPNNYCGIGACVIDHPKKIPKKIKEHTKDSKKVIKEDPIIVQSYIPNPLLIHGYKFDFRIYVLVTSVDPLRIYLYRDGLVRFATEKFSLAPEDLANTFIHLTNFTLNKSGEAVSDYPPGVQVNKWSVYELWDWLKERGEDPEPFWEGVKDVVIKTILCGHRNISAEVKQKVGSLYNNYNLLGLDIFIDTDYKPHLLEVNTIPSLFINKVSEEIDLRLKAPLVAESLNICGHHISSSVSSRHRADISRSHLGGSDQPLGFDHRLYCKVATEAEGLKQRRFCPCREEGEEAGQKLPETPDSGSEVGSEAGEQEQEKKEQEEEQGTKEQETKERKTKEKEDKQEQEQEQEHVEEEDGSEYSYYSDSGEGSEEVDVIEDMSDIVNDKRGVPEEECVEDDDILADLTPCDVRVLVHSEEELTQCSTYQRIFPTPNTGHYLQYTEGNYYDLLLLAWEKRQAGGREEGRARLAELTAKGVHLEVPAGERRVPHPPPREKPAEKKRNFREPHIFRR